MSEIVFLRRRRRRQGGKIGADMQPERQAHSCNGRQTCSQRGIGKR